MTTTQYLRDPSVVQYVLYAAGGRCEHCESEAPFLRNDGTPYLEVHHVRFLANGGPDTICNAVALCPNCHRACHSSENARELKSAIVKKLERLIDY